MNIKSIASRDLHPWVTQSTHYSHQSLEPQRSIMYHLFLFRHFIIFWYRHFWRALYILCLCTSPNSVSYYLKPNLQPNCSLQAIRLVLVELLQIQLINEARVINGCIAYMLHQIGFLKSLSIEFKWVLLWPFFFLMILLLMCSFSVQTMPLELNSKSWPKMLPPFASWNY